jgi:light-regulated signal transduction histidine kinase (bacteriophytochrome)
METPNNLPVEQSSEGSDRTKKLKSSLDDCLAVRRVLEKELALALEASDIADAEMQHFIYAVGHDLRTPLRSISSYAKLLQRQFADDQETSELTGFILDGAAEMNTLIEDLLRYSRTGGTPRRTTINLHAIVQFALMNLQPQINETSAEIKLGELPELAVDESQCVQLFQQLIGNALKFRGAEVPKIEVAAEEQADGFVVSVRDNGPGIEPQYHETVFIPFKRLPGREVPGTGLGLSICQKIVRAHGGKIWVESDGAHGSTFKFTVPF